MGNRRAVLVAGFFLLLAFSPCTAQDNKALEQDLSTYYIGKTFDSRQAYLNREVWYDQDGNITENPTPVCENIYGRIEVTRVRVRADRVDVEVTRSGQHPPMQGGKPLWPDYASREVTLRFRSPSGWSVDSFDKAFQNSLRPRGRFDLLPAGATPPSTGDDKRIAFYYDGAPVYRTGMGVTPPKQAGRMLDPEYTEAARRARAGGTVLLRFIVNEDGSPSDVHSAQPPLGFGLDEQAVRTAQQWRFTPAMLDGRPVKVDMRAETNFCLY